MKTLNELLIARSQRSNQLMVINVFPTTAMVATGQYKSERHQLETEIHQLELEIRAHVDYIHGCCKFSFLRDDAVELPVRRRA